MSTLVAQTISNGTVSTSSANVIQGSAKAWVEMSNTTNGGTTTILASYNVSSISKTGAGQYQVNFTNAFADTNYTPVVSTAYGLNNGNFAAAQIFSNASTSNYTAPTTSGFYFIVVHTSNLAVQDGRQVSVAVFR
jgi:hypothetical protein